ncbi:hypothetical protein ACFXKJ_04150 [Kitasatospora indigofera]
MRTEATWGVRVFTYLFLLVLFIEIPLVAGTSFGMVCWRWRSARPH